MVSPPASTRIVRRFGLRPVPLTAPPQPESPGEFAATRRARYTRLMRGVLRTFSSFQEAEDADRAFYASLSPRERVEILLDIVQRHRESLREAPEGFARVYRVVEQIGRAHV